jgi:hypothetical protein
VFEQLTDRSRQILGFAYDEADHLKHSSVRTEHILLGLVRETEGIGGRVLRSFGMALEPMRQKVQLEARTSDVDALDSSTAVDHLKMALRVALGLGHSFVGTEHILLALVAGNERESVAVRVLVDLGVDPDEVRVRTAQLMSGLESLDTVSEHRGNSIKGAVNNITPGFRVELPDADDTNAGPGLFDLAEISSVIPATFGPEPFAQGLIPRRGGDGKTLEPGTTEALRRFSAQAETSLTRVRFLNADIADVEFSIRYRNQTSRSFVGRVVRHEGCWLVTTESIRQVLIGSGIELPPDP